MKKLNNEEMFAVSGGGYLSLGGLVIGLAIFVIGYFDGLIHPKKCE